MLDAGRQNLLHETDRLMCCSTQALAYEQLMNDIEICRNGARSGYRRQPDCRSNNGMSW